MRERASNNLPRSGRCALVALRAAAMDKDPERAMRAKDLLKTMEGVADLVQIEGVIRVLAARQPPRTLTALLDYLADCPDESTIWLIRESLVAAARRHGSIDPELIAGLGEPHAVCRAAAVQALGRISGADPHTMRPLLKDRNPGVRFEAALALARTGQRDGIPTLIDLLEDGSTAAQAQDQLQILAGAKAPAWMRISDEASRGKARAAWTDWWQANGATADLAVLRPDGQLSQGVTVVAEITPKGGLGSKLWEQRGDKKVQWELPTGHGIIDVQILPGGHLLFAEYDKVSERDRTGKVFWSVVVDQAVNCQRLANGNIFIANHHAMMEVNRDGTVLTTFTYPEGGEIQRACRLANGHTVFACASGKLVEMNARGAKVRGNPSGFCRKYRPHWAGTVAQWMLPDQLVFPFRRPDRG